MYQPGLFDELIIDNFAGGGGASHGIELALGHHVDIAINHDPEAVAMHRINHPHTRHYCEDVWSVDPLKITGGRPVGLAWFSPDCKHFSKAKGGQPVSKKIRGLAWVVIRYARAVHPRVIMLENVEEFQTWGPLTPVCDKHGEKKFGDNGKPLLKPCEMNQGRTFYRWVSCLEKLGYTVEWKELRACDYGAPTIRKRLFLVARCDGNPIIWPEPTHGSGLLPYRTAADCIDWSIQAPSIFERKRPLAENTLKRIAKGIQKFVIDTNTPFIVPIANYNGSVTVHSIDEPLRTITAWPKGNALALAVPHIQRMFGNSIGHAVDEPTGTVTAGGGGKSALVSSYLIKLRGTCRNGHSITKPMPTVTADGLHIGEVRSFLIKYYGTAVGQSIKEPMHTVTTKHRLGLVTVAGKEYRIVDIGLRMLSPRELFRAQGFCDDYIIDPVVNGRPLSKAAQVRMCGNSVSPYPAKALVAANVKLKAINIAA